MTNTKHMEILSYLVQAQKGLSFKVHVEAGNSGGASVYPFQTLKAMERKGLLELSWKRQDSLYGTVKPYRVGYITAAGLQEWLDNENA